jgi:colanic acid/amylovoran biosynthesis glycosyltransferase
MQELHTLQANSQTSPSLPKPRIAYLLSQYPAVSHTFFLKEILGLKQLGFQVETASINPTDRSFDLLPPQEAEEAQNTYYIKSLDVKKILRVMPLLAIRNLPVCSRGLRAALILSGWDLRASLYSLLYLAEALLLGEWMKKRSLTHLHIHFGGPVSTVGMLASKAWGFSYSLTLHGPEEFYDVYASYLPQKIEGAKFIFCISNFCRSQAMKYAQPAHWQKLHVLRLGVNPEEFRPVPKNTDHLLKIVSVGRLVPAKGQLILLQAIHSLFTTKQRNVHLTLIGDGPERDNLQEFVDRHGLSQHITFCGALNHDQTREHLAYADIFALASFAEGVPVALMEAMAMEIPCISTNVAGIPELIRSGIDGLLVPASSVNDLANAIQTLADDEELRKKIGSTARARVLDCYNLPRNLQTLASAFERYLS